MADFRHIAGNSDAGKGCAFKSGLPDGGKAVREGNPAYFFAVSEREGSNFSQPFV